MSFLGPSVNKQAEGNRDCEGAPKDDQDEARELPAPCEEAAKVVADKLRGYVSGAAGGTL